MCAMHMMSQAMSENISREKRLYNMLLQQYEEKRKICGFPALTNITISEYEDTINATGEADISNWYMRDIMYVTLYALKKARMILNPQKNWK